MPQYAYLSTDGSGESASKKEKGNPESLNIYILITTKRILMNQ